MWYRLSGVVDWWRSRRPDRGHRPGSGGNRAADRALDSACRRPVLTLLDLSEGPDPTVDLGWRTTIRRRVAVIFVCLGLWSIAIQARLVQLQVVRHDAYMARAENQQERVLETMATRGDIVDRHGHVLAYSVDTRAIAADPSAVDDPEGTVEALCRALADCTSGERTTFIERLSSEKRFAWIRRSLNVSPGQVQRVVEANLPGVFLIKESRRYYPNMNLAAHVLGFVGTDNVGLGGIEAKYDDEIRGSNGVLFLQRDARQRDMAPRVEREPTAGATLELTLDRNLQHIVERELQAAVRENNARGGTVIVMDPNTGEVLALANYPTFNPNAYNQSPSEDRRNRAIQEVYEPGSTFKIVTASAALEEGVIRPTDLIDTRPSYIMLGARRINDLRDHGVLPFEDVIVESSNVGAIKVGLEVGAELLGRYVRRFGFGQTLAPDLLGESVGIVRNPATLSDSDLASMSIGYAVGVTPLQMATAVSAIANGGRLMEPRFLRAIVRDGVREVIEPRELRRAVRPEVASVLTTFMEGVVERGTGTRAALDGYQVAGKTGTTARIIDGRYSKTDYNASFVGFVPSRRPVYTILIVIDTPLGDSYYGGAVAAPVFKRIAEAGLLQAGVLPTLYPTPPVVVAGPVQARVRPVRTPVVIPTLARTGGQAVMPDVRGLSARDAVRVLSDLGLTVDLLGSGIVTGQTPVAGQPVASGESSHLELLKRPLGSRQDEGGR
jgi:cell division protein FtsI (penicillin-binding protein 3)